MSLNAWQQHITSYKNEPRALREPSDEKNIPITNVSHNLLLLYNQIHSFNKRQIIGFLKLMLKIRVFKLFIEFLSCNEPILN